VANLKASKKAIRQSEKRRERNQAVRSAIKTFVKKTRVAIQSGTEEAPSLLQATASLVDKAAKRGVIHKNAAARRKSRLARRMNAARNAASPTP
jgi:small subunit ribosomal protein S20